MVWRAGWVAAVGTTVAGWFVAGIVFRGGLGYLGGVAINEIVGFIVYLLACAPIVVLGERGAARAT